LRVRPLSSDWIDLLDLENGAASPRPVTLNGWLAEDDAFTTGTLDLPQPHQRIRGVEDVETLNGIGPDVPDGF
ncbi:MAG: hypothetical protein ACYC23_19850, partial [Limisphaerales bacterium]